MPPLKKKRKKLAEQWASDMTAYEKPDLANYEVIKIRKEDIVPGLLIYKESVRGEGDIFPWPAWWVLHEVAETPTWYYGEVSKRLYSYVKTKIIGGNKPVGSYKEFGSVLVWEGGMLTVYRDPRLIDVDPFAFYDEWKGKPRTVPEGEDPFEFMEQCKKKEPKEINAEGEVIIRSKGGVYESKDPAKIKQREKDLKKREKDRSLYEFNKYKGAGDKPVHPKQEKPPKPKPVEQAKPKAKVTPKFNRNKAETDLDITPNGRIGKVSFKSGKVTHK